MNNTAYVEVNPVCPCTNPLCDKRGDCAACRERHISDTVFCELPPEEQKRRTEATPDAL